MRNDRIFLLCLNSVKVLISLMFAFSEFAAWRLSPLLVLLLMLVDIANGKIFKKYFNPPKNLIRIFDSLADKLAIFIVIFSALLNHTGGWPILIVLLVIEGAKLLGGVMAYKRGILFFPKTWQKGCLLLAGLGGIAFLMGHPLFTWMGIVADFVSAAYYIKHSELLQLCLKK